MSYLEFVNHINKNKINIIFELGSRDLIDSIKLVEYFGNSTIYAFECNPECLIECNKRFNQLDAEYKKKINLIDKAVSIVDGYVNFYPIDLSQYNNMGASSLLKIDFSSRDKNDPDYNLKNIQKEILTEGIRLDTFINKNNINNIDLLCIDLQGYELNALKSLGDNLYNVKYIITECSIENTYINGANFIDLNKYLSDYNFTYICSNKFGTNLPNLKLTGFSEFDALFINKNLL